MAMILHRPEHFKGNKSGPEQLVSLRTRPDGAMLGSANIDTSKRRWHLTTDESQISSPSGGDVLYHSSENPSTWNDIPQDILDDVGYALESLRQIYLSATKPRKNPRQSFTDSDWENVLAKKESSVKETLIRDLEYGKATTLWSTQRDDVHLEHEIEDCEGLGTQYSYSLRVSLSREDYRGTISRQFTVRFGKAFLPYQTQVWATYERDTGRLRESTEDCYIDGATLQSRGIIVRDFASIAASTMCTVPTDAVSSAAATADCSLFDISVAAWTAIWAEAGRLDALVEGGTVDVEQSSSVTGSLLTDSVPDTSLDQ